MPDLLTNLGLHTTRSLAASSLSPIPNYTPHIVAANFFLAYILSSTRLPKLLLGMDNNVSPRQDLDAAVVAPLVRSGRVSQAQVDRLRRLQGAHANGIEGFPLVVAALVCATQAGVPSHVINKYGVAYTLARVAYTLVYVNGTSRGVAGVRSVLFWVGNVLCLRLLWLAGKGFS